MLSRFFNSFGTPKKIISDNRGAFVSDETQLFIGNRNVKCGFDHEATPWAGGFFERLFKSVKRWLRKILWKAKINFVETNTILINIQNVLNNRPLTVQLVPNDFTLRRRINNDNIDDDNTNYDESETGTRRYRYVQHLIDTFWKQRQAEYLQELREKQLKHSKLSSKYEISTHDITITQQDKYTRRN